MTVYVLEDKFDQYVNQIQDKLEKYELMNTKRPDDIISTNKLIALATLYSTVRHEDEVISILKSLEKKL